MSSLIRQNPYAFRFAATSHVVIIQPGPNKRPLTGSAKILLLAAALVGLGAAQTPTASAVFRAPDGTIRLTMPGTTNLLSGGGIFAGDPGSPRAFRSRSVCIARTWSSRTLQANRPRPAAYHQPFKRPQRRMSPMPSRSQEMLILRNSRISGLARYVLAAVIGAAVPLGAQTPVINAVVDAASYTPTLGVPSSIVTLFGANLASTTASAQVTPLPVFLAGTSVTWGGITAHLLYVSPTQINLQAPSMAPILTGPGIVVSTSAGVSAVFDPPIATPNTWETAGLFSVDGSGCGQSAALIVLADGTVSVNSTRNSVPPGAWISLFGTGIELNYPAQLPPDGEPSLPTVDRPPWGAVYLDSTIEAAPLYGGFAPGLVGVAQVNIQVPTTVREGCAVPLQWFYNWGPQALTQPLTLAIRQGGGPCVDPPPAGFGEIVWQKSIDTQPGSPGQPEVVTENDSVTASFQSAPGMSVPVLPTYSEGALLPASMTFVGPSCPVPGYRSLAAGTVTVNQPNGNSASLAQAPYQEDHISGLSINRTTLPKSSIGAGSSTIQASGGADVGKFQAEVNLGSDIQIQTDPTGSHIFAGCAVFTLNWTGGDANSWVTVRLIEQLPATAGGFQVVDFAKQVHASDGTITMTGMGTSGRQPCATSPATPVTVSVEVDPDPSQIVTFTAPGLSLGGRATWKYVHTFAAGLVLQN